MRIEISPLTAATLIALALILTAAEGVAVYSEFVGFDRPAIGIVPCDTDSDCEAKNPHIARP